MSEHNEHEDVEAHGIKEAVTLGISAAALLAGAAGTANAMVPPSAHAAKKPAAVDPTLKDPTLKDPTLKIVDASLKYDATYKFS
jgi:hypothetical protein